MGLDWTIDIGEARRRVGHKVALQGNLDPNVLFASPDKIAAEAKKVLDSFGPGHTGHVFNLGHGISQFTPPEHVSMLVETVHRQQNPARNKPLSFSTPKLTYAQKVVLCNINLQLRSKSELKYNPLIYNEI